jgi:aldose 1-epimerase
MKKNNLGLIALIISIMIATSCNNSTETKQTATVDSIKAGIIKTNWGVSDGKEVLLFTLTNKKGVEVKISNYGATVTSWVAPIRRVIKAASF